MNKDTGVLSELDEEQAKELEKAFAKQVHGNMIPVPQSDLDAVQLMNFQQRLAYASKREKTQQEINRARRERKKRNG